MKSKISLCMIVRDEEAFLDKCLQSVVGVVDETVVVDTGSTDSSAEIAKRHGARVLSHPWQNDFAEARNFALDAASGDWILVLDADEELPEESRARMKDIVDTTKADGVEMTVRGLMPETDVLKYEDSRIVRLFRNKKDYRYVLPVLEQIRPSIEKNHGVIISSDLIIVNRGYSYEIVQGGAKRGQRILEILSAALSASPANPYLRCQLGLTMMSAGQRDEAYTRLKSVLELDYEQMGPALLDRLFMKMSQIALDRNENEEAVWYAGKSLEYNPDNGISMYVAAIGLLSLNRISEGYEQLLKIKRKKDSSLRLDLQLDHLIKACKELLKI